MQTATLTIGNIKRPCTILKSDSVKGYFIQLGAEKLWVSKQQVEIAVSNSEADLLIQQNLS